MIRKIIFLTLILLLIALFSCTNLTEPVNPICWITYPEADGTWGFEFNNELEIVAKIEGMYKIKEDSIQVWITTPGGDSFESAKFEGYMTKMDGSDNLFYYKWDVSDSTKYQRENYYYIYVIAKDINGLGASDKRRFKLSSTLDYILKATILAKNKVKLSWDYKNAKYKTYAVFRGTKSEVNPYNGTLIGETSNQEITDNSALINQKVYYRLFIKIAGDYVPVGSSIPVKTLSKDWTAVPGWPVDIAVNDAEILNDNIVCLAQNKQPPTYTQYSNSQISTYNLSHQNIYMDDMIFSICPLNESSGWAGLWDRICYYINHTQVNGFYMDQMNPYKLIDDIQSGSAGTFAIAYNPASPGIRFLSYNSINNSWTDVSRANYKYHRARKIVLCKNGLVWLYGKSSGGEGSILCHNNESLNFNLDYEINGLAFNNDGTYGFAVTQKGIAGLYSNGAWSKYSFPSYIYQKLYLTSTEVISSEQYFFGTVMGEIYFYENEYMNSMKIETLPDEGSIWDIYLNTSLTNGFFIYKTSDLIYTRGYKLQ